jgi:RHS repeat-associated protein
MFLRLWQHRGAQRKSSRNGVPRRQRPGKVRLQLEVLEGRILPASPAWINPGSGNWDDGANWSTGQVPGPGDDALISTTAAATITIQSGDSITVHSLTTAGPDTLSFTGGSLAVTSGSTFGGSLSMTAGSLTASGSGADLQVNGSSSIDGSSLYANSGGALNLPLVTSYSGPTNSDTSIHADGTGSQINLGNLTTLNGAVNGFVDVEVSGGGAIDLHQLPQVTNGDVEFRAFDSGSVINLSALTTLTTTSGNDALQSYNGATLDIGKLTTLDNVAVFIGSDATAVPVAQITSLTNGSLTAGDGATVTLSNLATFTNDSFYAIAAGVLNLPLVTSYSGPTNSVTSIHADGAGSQINLGNLTTFNGATGGFVDIEVSGGGAIDMHQLPKVTSGDVEFRAFDSGSVLNLSALTTLTTTNGNDALQSYNGATLDIGKLTTLDNVAVFIGSDATAAPVAQITSLTNGSLTAGDGATVTLSNLATFTNDSFYAISAGALNLPLVTSYSGQTSSDTYIHSDGAGSQINLGNLTTLNGAVGGSMDVEVSGGGAIDLHQLPKVTSGDVQFRAFDSGSVLNLTALTQGNITLTSGPIVTVEGAQLSLPADGTSGATINVPQSQGLNISFQNSGTLSATTFNVGPGTTIDLAGGTYDGGTTFNVGAGATADLTGVYTTTYQGTLTGSGSGTVLLSSGTFYPGLGGVTLNFHGSMFQWTAGPMELSVGNVINQGTINLSGASEAQIYADGTLDNYGTVIQSGTGDFGLHSDNVAPTTLKIESGAQWLIESDAGIANLHGSNVIDNAGTIRKTAGIGTSIVQVQGAFNNSGTIEADSGTLGLQFTSSDQVSGSTLSGGTWKALDGATLQFPTGTSLTSNAATLVLDGTGAQISGIDGLAANNGSLAVSAGASFTTTGDFTNSGSLTLGAGSTLTVGGSYTQTNAGTLDVQVGGTPASGLFGQIGVGHAAALAGGFGLSLVNGFLPSFGQDYKVLTFASASGTFQTFTGLKPYFTESLGSTSMDLVDSAANPVDLVLNNVTAATTATAGQQITVNWQVSDPGSQAASGSWQDSVYLSATSAITPHSILLASVAHSGGLPAGSSYNGAWTGALPALPPGYYNVLVQVDSFYQVPDPTRDDNILSATTGQLHVTVPTLTLGTPYNDTFTAADQDRYYQVTVPAGGSLSIALTSSASSGTVALYVSPSSVPTPFRYEEASASANQPDPTVLVPQVGTSTTYYILAHSVSGAAATAGFDLTVTQSSGLAVSAISSYAGGNGGNVTIDVHGSNFSRQTTASLGLGTTTIKATSIYYQSASELFATFNLVGAAVGSYTLTVQDGGNTASAPTAFPVVAATTGNPVSLHLQPPALVSAGRDSVVTVTVTNTSNDDVLAPLLQLSTDGATLKLPAQPSFQGRFLSFLATSPTGPAGTLTPGESVQVVIDFQSTTTNPTINFQLYQADDSKAMDWTDQEQSLQLPTIPNLAWPVVWVNFVANMGSTVASYHAVLAADATYLAQLGEPTNDVLQLVEFEIEKADNAYTADTLATVTPEDLPAPGMNLSFEQSYMAPISGRYYQGMLGWGWTTSWDISAHTPATGNVAIRRSGVSSYFLLQANGTYQSTTPGHDGEVLTSSAGAYRLLEPNGTVYQFNTDGTLAYVQDANGNRITADYSNGRLATLTDANGEYLQLTYDTQGQLKTLTDSNGQTETYGYTGQFLTSYSDIYGTTTYTYVNGETLAQSGALEEIAYADNTHIYFNYDNQGRLIDQHRDGGGDDIQFTYLNPGGLVTTDGDGNKTTSLFNLEGATAEAIDALGHVTLFKYDANLNLVHVEAPGGLTASFAYDPNGNVISATDPLGQTTGFTYDVHNNLTSYSDARGNTTSYAYDTSNNLLSITYANGTSQQYSYNPLGEATQFVNARGKAIGYTYNADGLVATETFADGTSYSYSYTARGHLKSATDAQGNVTTFVYGDSSNPTLLTEIDYPDGTWLKFKYNIVAQRTQSVDQTGFTINYNYDALGRLAKLTDGNGNLIILYAYDAAGNLIQKDIGNGTRTIYTYNGDGQRLSITNYAPDHVTVNSFDVYTYDALGNVHTETNQDGQWVYTYDADSQLTGAVFTPNGTNPDGLSAQDLQYVYDAAGNRISETVNSVVTTYVANNVNEYTSSSTVGVGTTTYKYDADANLVSTTDAGGNTAAYTFNDLNELTAVSGPGLTASYAYNPFGERVSQVVNGVRTNFQIDPAGLGHVVAAFNGSGVYNNSSGLTAHYTYGFGLVSQVAPGGPASYYDFGITGNTVGITGSAGTYVNKYAYLPFGQMTVIRAALANPFSYVGQAGVSSDGSGLVQMRLRAYDPSTGQFTANDPLNLLGGDTNLRRYATNDPSFLIDPSGLDSGTAVDPEWLFNHPPEPKCSERSPLSNFICRIGTGFNKAESNVPSDVSKGLLGAYLGSTAEGLPGAAVGWGGGFLTDWVGDFTNGFLEGNPNHDYFDEMLGPGDSPNAPGGAGGGGDGCSPAPPPDSSPDTPNSPGPGGGTPNHKSDDPNALIGPAGSGTKGFIQLSGNWSYTAQFENDGTAAALGVTVTEQLDSNLDWPTFQLGSFGFGPENVTIPAGLTQYQATVAYQNTDGTPLNVQVSLDFNVQAGLLTVSYTSLDPATGEPPTGVVDGFLPPDDSTHVGEGFVQYTVEPKAGLITGTAINQQASIVFDTNAALATNIASNTIDAVAPTSSVNPLPAVSLTSFPVSWAGQDDPGGSGVGSYDIYVSDNGGPWQLWQSHTSQTSAVYAGQLGHAYAFYSVATDNAGNMEVKAAAIGAQTHTPVLESTISQPEGTAKPTPIKIATALGTHYSDPDKNTRPGIAITTATGNGTWQYSTNGKSWVNIATVADTSALLLPAGDSLRFLPAGLWTGEADLLYVAWDGSGGSAGSYANASTLGGGTPFSTIAGMLAVIVTPAAHAPILLASAATLAPVLPGDANPAGQTVDQAFGGLVSVGGNRSIGVAVIGLTATAQQGTWQYQLSGGGWKNFPRLTASTALLLGDQDLLRFLPAAGFTGTVSLQLRAWDGNTGSDGGTINLSKSNSFGGTTAFSSTSLIGLLHVNHAPTQSPPAGNITLPATVENVASKPMPVATLLQDAHAADADKGTLLGIGITTASGPGTWQYRLVGGWQAVPAGAALLLPPSALVRFQPAIDQVGTASLTWYAWDQTQGSRGTTYAISPIGGATAFSTATATATLAVTTATSHQPPGWTSKVAALTAVLPDTTNPPGDTVASIFGAYYQASAPGVGIAVAALTGANNGTWQYSLDGVHWQPIANVSPTRALLLSAAYRIRFVPKPGFIGTASLTAYAWDASTGTAGDIASIHSGTAFSRGALTAICLVNTAPTLSS